MNESNTMGQVKIELAILQETICKYETSSAKFTIPTLMTSSKQESKTPNKSSNIMNKENNLGISNATTSNYVTLKVPEEYLITYPDKYIPIGTRFLVACIGGDITQIHIIGRLQ